MPYNFKLNMAYDSYHEMNLPRGHPDPDRGLVEQHARPRWVEPLRASVVVVVTLSSQPVLYVSEQVPCTAVRMHGKKEQ